MIPLRIQGLVAVIQLQQKTYTVRHCCPAYFVEEIVHCQQFRHRKHLGLRIVLRGLGQPLPEEDHGPPVRENKAQVTDILCVVIVLCYLFQKLRHSYIISFIVPSIIPFIHIYKFR